MSEQEKELRILRDQIDSIDRQIHELLNRRASCAQNVAEVKQKYQGEVSAVFYRPEREAQVLRAVMERNEGPLADKEVARLFREVMSVCLALEEPMRVAFLGPEGTFTQQAAMKHFGHSARNLPMQSLKDVFREVQAGGAHYGVVPIENSTEGVVSHTLDLFKQFDLNICGEVEVPVHLHLLLNRGDTLDGISKIYSHQQSLAQSRGWLDARYPDIEKVAVSSNAEAAKLVAKEGAGCAAIAGDMAADLYDLDMAVKNIEDQADNTTRFLIIGNQDVGPSNDDKTSILISVPDTPGALYQVLEPFHRYDLSLTRVETRSAAKNSLFYIDFEGHFSDTVVNKALQELTQSSMELKILGSYPRAVL
ncbi:MULTISPECIES: prephenate dehydratase [unclassified Neptuniibacter]|uniref:prephenate dehydratase n=1 Tax=unclassified Neptuniibacter TaxID=2630693 RepID=UPI000C4A7281|nr:MULTISPECIES: prephenate dehydratase [unclassified Neptuniibacter]MAY42738.1 prephenate dehydratase [Oceanospirillaceae bacterium]|tara:strand:+ start:59015 stop:60106 length:1092 start_codon:yes stop_codon:yes gene_type:complete